jgi:hypothetical protein
MVHFRPCEKRTICEFVAWWQATDLLQSDLAACVLRELGESSLGKTGRRGVCRQTYKDLVGRTAAFKDPAKRKHAGPEVRSAGQAIRYWVLRRNGYMVTDLGYQVGPITLGLQGRWIGMSVERSPNHHQAQQACHDLASHLVACPRARRQSVLLAVISTLGFRLRYITLDWLQKEHSIGHPRIPLDLVSSPARSKKNGFNPVIVPPGITLKDFYRASFTVADARYLRCNANSSWPRSPIENH